MRTISRASRSAIVMLVAALWLVASTVASAPAPLPRSQARHRLPLRCVMTWQNQTYATTFAACGAYHATDGVRHWYGTWYLDGRRLVVREYMEPGGSVLHWECELDARLRHGIGVSLGP